MQTLIYTLRLQTTRASAFAVLEYIGRHPSANSLLTVPD